MERYDPLITNEMVAAGFREMSGDEFAVWDEVIRDVFAAMMKVVLSDSELSARYRRLLCESS